MTNFFLYSYNVAATLSVAVVINVFLLTQTLSGGVCSPTELCEGRTLCRYLHGSL